MKSENGVNENGENEKFSLWISVRFYVFMSNFKSFFFKGKNQARNITHRFTYSN